MCKILFRLAFLSLIYHWDYKFMYWLCRTRQGTATVTAPATTNTQPPTCNFALVDRLFQVLPFTLQAAARHASFVAAHFAYELVDASVFFAVVVFGTSSPASFTLRLLVRHCIAGTCQLSSLSINSCLFPLLMEGLLFMQGQVRAKQQGGKLHVLSQILHSQQITVYSNF